ncbi:MAG TPA: hypothetical protein VJS63_16505 [Bradyrhizobium sp.]|nr:hypothetical protein [Bradyrhizobium sp.]
MPGLLEEVAVGGLTGLLVATLLGLMSGQRFYTGFVLGAFVVAAFSLVSARWSMLFGTIIATLASIVVAIAARAVSK